mgnify:CR=1 FL=1
MTELAAPYFHRDLEQNTPEWIEIRCGIPTASRMAEYSELVPVSTTQRAHSSAAREPRTDWVAMWFRTVDALVREMWLRHLERERISL